MQRDGQAVALCMAHGICRALFYRLCKDIADGLLLRQRPFDPDRDTDPPGVPHCVVQSVCAVLPLLRLNKLKEVIVFEQMQ